MARTNRPPSEHLTFLARARETVRLWGLFPLLRGAEARAPHLPRIGRARLPAENIVDLGQRPAQGFAESTLAEIEQKNGRTRVTGNWMGLLGPMGPMPMHLTEFAEYEARYSRQRPFGRFMDMLSGRALQLFYRAWADSQPAAQRDRPEDDRFAGYVGALSGASEGVREDSPFPATARLHYAGLFASRRSPAVIEDLMSDVLGQSARVIEYRPCWRALEPEDRSRLGVGEFARIGMGAMLGTRTRAVTDTFRIVISARSAGDYATLLPDGRRFPLASAALNAIAPGHLDWEILLTIEKRHAAPARLGGTSQLGWSSWMQRPTDSLERRGDAHLRRTSRPRERATPTIGGLEA